MTKAGDGVESLKHFYAGIDQVSKRIFRFRPILNDNSDFVKLTNSYNLSFPLSLMIYITI